MIQFSPEGFNDYELLDCGDFKKLERFGKYITIRPEPQAVWSPVMSEKEWNSRAHVRFESRSSSSGDWKKSKEMPDQWTIEYRLPSHKKIRLRLGLTSFKHVGVFPEQAANWDFISTQVSKLRKERSEVKVLNLFAYTGAASLAARAEGADVTHLDAIRQVVSWARENMEKSGLEGIRWLIEDAMTFVRREVKRGKKYQGIILDPPAYGHGPNGESWKLEEMINEMMAGVAALLEEEKSFLVLNTYSLGFSSLIIRNLLEQHFPSRRYEFGEIALPSTQGPLLPLGVVGRIEAI